MADVESRAFEPAPSGITAVDAWIEDLEKRWDIDQKAAFRARVCISEIAGNIVEHGQTPDSGQFWVTVWRRGKALDIEITDAGLPFDPTSAPEVVFAKSAETAKVGGLGIHLVRSLATDVRYSRDDGKNCIRFHLAAV